MQTHVLSGRAFTLWCGSSKGAVGLGAVFLCMLHWIRSTCSRSHTHAHTPGCGAAYTVISHILCVPDLQILARLMLRQHTHTHTHSQRARARVLGFSPLRRVWICVCAVDRHVQSSSSSFLFREYLSRIFKRFLLFFLCSASRCEPNSKSCMSLSTYWAQNSSASERWNMWQVFCGFRGSYQTSLV